MRQSNSTPPPLSQSPRIGTWLTCSPKPGDSGRKSSNHALISSRRTWVCASPSPRLRRRRSAWAIGITPLGQSLVRRRDISICSGTFHRRREWGRKWKRSFDQASNGFGSGWTDYREVGKQDDSNSRVRSDGVGPQVGTFGSLPLRHLQSSAAAGILLPMMLSYFGLVYATPLSMRLPPDDILARV